MVKVAPPGPGAQGRTVLQVGKGHSPHFINFNSNKRSLVLALEQPQGREILLELARKFGVFVENYGPGVVEKLDIGYEMLRGVNPKIIYARMTGFGTSGPYAAYKSFDPIAQATAGAVSVTGRRSCPVQRRGTRGPACSWPWRSLRHTSSAAAPARVS